METKLVKITSENTEKEIMEEAAEILKRGGLVAFPTETVYGLGANAYDETAAMRIYQAKGRPSDNPLIVHIAKEEEILPLVKEVPESAEKLMNAFWPGPLTMILPKSDRVPKTTTGGLDTVAVRMPSHKAAMEMILAAGLPIAAPSANSSGRPSPTTAEHVYEDLNGKIDMIIDGGEVGIGVESTIVDLTGDIPTILRPGYITRDMLEQVLGEVAIDPAIVKINEGDTSVTEGCAPKAPGMKYRHYAPKAPLTLVEGKRREVEIKLGELSEEARKKGFRTGIICGKGAALSKKADRVYEIAERDDLEAIARNLYGTLRQCDEDGLDMIFSDEFGLNHDMKLGYAILNRLMKAAGGHVIKA